MSFYTSSNRILVKDAAGATTLDTDQPMPHILQTATVTKTVTFPSAEEYDNHYHFTYTYHNQSYYGCKYETVCKWEGLNYVCGPEYVCGTQYDGIRTEVVCDNFYGFNAKEWNSVQNLVAIDSGLDIDFIQVRCEGTRTATGKDPVYGNFVSLLPAGQFVCAGSMVVESSFRPTGQSWLRRLMSIYVEGGYVKVEFKHSNSSLPVGSGHATLSVTYSPPSAGPNISNPEPIPTFVNNSSTFSFTFHITLGKFTS